MDIRVLPYVQKLSRQAADCVEQQLKAKPDSVLGLATGSTPLPLYQELIHRCHRGLSFAEVTTFNLDEYLGLPGDHPASYRYYMERHLFSHIDISPNRTYVPDGMAVDVKVECLRYEKAIRKAGGIDLQILGMGRNGHIGFNEPGTPFGLSTTVIKLAESTRKANARFFESIDAVPQHAISMGIRTIMNARNIVLLVAGADKADAVKAAFEGPVTEEMPASVLQLHPNLTVLLDREASSKLLLDFDASAGSVES